jgi:hypothetical protein
MADASPHLERQEGFWKPAALSAPEDPAHDHDLVRPVCPNCGTDFLIGARFCYICGTGRHVVAAPQPGLRVWSALAHLPSMLELSVASLIAMVLGCACVVAAVVTGFVFTATTLLDWQAVQIWRIEWLLAAIALFAVGVLLKKR